MNFLYRPYLESCYYTYVHFLRQNLWSEPLLPCVDISTLWSMIISSGRHGLGNKYKRNTLQSQVGLFFNFLCAVYSNLDLYPSCEIFVIMWYWCCIYFFKCVQQSIHVSFISSADNVSSAELMVLLIVRRPSSSVVRPSTFALNRYSSYSSYSIILNFLLEKLGI